MPAIIVASPWESCPAGSLASRPATRIDGNVLELDTEKPMAMSPDASSAALPIHRLSESGAYVPCWPSDQPEPGLFS